MGLSHGLKTLHRTVFLTPFRVPLFTGFHKTKAPTRGAFVLWQRYAKLIQCTALRAMHHGIGRTTPCSMNRYFAKSNSLFFPGFLAVICTLPKLILECEINECHIPWKYNHWIYQKICVHHFAFLFGIIKIEAGCWLINADQAGFIGRVFRCIPH